MAERVPMPAAVSSLKLLDRGQRTRVRLVGFTTDTTVGLATQMTFDSEIGRLIWAPIAPIHRAFARDFLDRAVAEAAR